MQMWFPDYCRQRVGMALTWFLHPFQNFSQLRNWNTNFKAASSHSHPESRRRGWARMNTSAQRCLWWSVSENPHYILGLACIFLPACISACRYAGFVCAFFSIWEECYYLVPTFSPAGSLDSIQYIPSALPPQWRSLQVHCSADFSDFREWCCIYL